MSNAHLADYEYINFGDLDSESKRFWISVLIFASNFKSFLGYASFVIAIFGLFGNIFHLAVLTRKSMRNSSVTVFLIGIAICDLFRMIGISHLQMFYEEFVLLNTPETCVAPKSYLEMFLLLTLGSLEMIASDLPVWFAVFMTIFRALVMRYPMHQQFNSLVTSKAGLWAVIPISVMILPFTILLQYQITIEPISTWHPSPDCLGFPSNYTQIEYYYAPTELMEVFIHFEGILFKFIPSVVLSIATLVLVFELRKWKKVKITIRKRSDKERTSKLVVFVTLTFLIASIPQGVSYIVIFQTLEASIFRLIVNEFSILYSFLSIANGTIHFLISYFLASEYRKAAKHMFLFWKKDNEVSNVNISKTGNIIMVTQINRI